MLTDISITTLAIATGAGLTAGAVASQIAEHLPAAMARSWRTDALAALELEQPGETDPAPHFSDPLHHACASCEGRQTAICSLPILSWALPGTCPAGHSASKGERGQRAALELLAVLITLGLLLTQGASWATAAVIGASLVLLTLTAIDLRAYLLPDVLTLPLLWAGLLYHLVFRPESLPDAVIGAAMGYLMLWGIYWIFRLVTGKHAMGHGDFKLLAALGAWTGWQTLPAILFAGALLGILIQLLVPTLRKRPIPFGPFLAVGGWVVLLGGPELTAVLRAIYLL